MTRILEILTVFVLLMWLLGAFVIPVGGRLIHELLIIAVLLAVVRIVFAFHDPSADKAAGSLAGWDAADDKQAV
jgi:hypothetical protein